MMSWDHAQSAQVRVEQASRRPRSSGCAGVIAGREYTVPPRPAGILGLFGVTDSLIFDARPSAGPTEMPGTHQEHAVSFALPSRNGIRRARGIATVVSASSPSQICD